jgi:hypothetical protein
MNLDPDNATLWTAGLETGNIYRINIATGFQVTTFPGFQPGDDVLPGLTIFGEIGPPPPLTPTPTTTRPPSLGGVAGYPDLSSDTGAGVLAGIAGAAAVAAATLGGAAWVARRRRVS